MSDLQLVHGVCEIQWVCKESNWDATPDTNPAIGFVRCWHDSVVVYKGLAPRIVGDPDRGYWSEWYPICAEHAKSLSELPNWEFRARAAAIGV